MPEAQNATAIGVPANLDLTALSDRVADRERTLAPVSGIAAGQDAQGGPVTALSFDMSKPPRTSKFARVKLLVGGEPVVGPDETLVCKGEAYISGALTGVFLVRAK